MIQELQTMNVQMRIITEDNIDQLMSMSYSSNIKTLLKDKNKDIADTIKNYKMNMDMKLSKASPVSSSPVSSSILSPASPVLLPSSSYSLPPISIPEEVEYVPSATQLEEIQQDNNMLTNSLITPYSSSKGVNELKDNLSLFLSPEEIKSITTDKKIKKSKWTSMSKPQQDSVKQYINTMKTDILEVPPELSEEEKEREEEGQKSSGSTKKITITSENN